MANAKSVNRQLGLMAAIEIPFRRDVYREKNRYIEQVAAEYARTNSISDRDFEEHQSKLQEIFNKYYKRAMVFFSSETEEQLKVISKKTALWEMLLRKWMTEKGGSRAKEVAGTTRDDIRRILVSATISEDPANVIITKILSARGLSAFRSDMIARTETHNAAMYASLETAKDIDADVNFETAKVWNATGDDRTREDHAAADGQKVPLAGYFTVGSERLEKPGDGSPEQSIQCRCVLTYEEL